MQFSPYSIPIPHPGVDLAGAELAYAEPPKSVLPDVWLTVVTTHSHNSQSTTMQTSILWLQIPQSLVPQLELFRWSTRFLSQSTYEEEAFAVLYKFQNYREILDNVPNFARLWTSKNKVNDFQLQGGKLRPRPISALPGLAPEQVMSACVYDDRYRVMTTVVKWAFSVERLRAE